MRLLGNTAMVLGLAGAMAIGSMTASEARGGRNAAFATNAGYYSGAYGYDSYGYAPRYYDSYAYEPAYAAPVYTPPSYYGPVTTYQSRYPGDDTNYIGPWRERQLQGRDY
jgi:hypothetical protein